MATQVVSNIQNLTALIFVVRCCHVRNKRSSRRQVGCTDYNGPADPAIADQDMWWASCPEGQEEEYREMQAKTRKYAERAREALKRDLLPIPEGYDSFCSSLEPYPKYLWINDEYDGSIRSNVIQLCGETPFPTFAEDATREMLMSATTTPQPGETRRRIIIVEDMNRRTAELLGVRLNIPPEFFFAHCQHKRLHLSVVNDASAPQLDQYWRVYLPGSRWILGPLNPEEHFGTWVVEAGLYSRGSKTLLIAPEGCDGVHLEIDEYVSFWATDYENESWTSASQFNPNSNFNTDLGT